MKKIYNTRANFLFDHFNVTGFEMNICTMLKKLFASEPSFTEETDCDKCKHSNSSTYPMVNLNNAIFANDFTNMEIAILANLPDKLACTRCKNDVECKREFGAHIFIEVIIFFKNQKFGLIIFDSRIYDNIFIFLN